jgi:type IV pilus assembly protein PilO
MAFNLRDPKNVRVVLSILLGAGAAYGFFATPLLPVNYPVASERIKELKGDFEKKSNDLARARQSVADLPRFQAEFAALHERYEMAAELLPTEKEMPGMLRRLTLAGQQCGVIFDSFRPSPEIVKDHYIEVPIEVVVKGGYHQVGQFLAEISNMPRIMRVSNLQLMADKKEDDDATTEARFTVTAYTLNPNAPAAAGDTKSAATPNPGGTNAGTAK